MRIGDNVKEWHSIATFTGVVSALVMEYQCKERQQRITGCGVSLLYVLRSTAQGADGYHTFRWI